MNDGAFSRLFHIFQLRKLKISGLEQIAIKSCYRYKQLLLQML